jgi:hypothetical protein
VYLKYSNPGAAGVSHPVYSPSSGSGANPGNVYTGAYMFEVDDSQPRTGLGADLPVGEQFGAFCIDITQYASGDYQAYEIRPLAEGPLTPLNGGMAMEADKAALLENLWFDHFQDAWVSGGPYTTAQKQAAEAFAACVWEIVFETDATLDITDGKMKIYNVDDASLANSWLLGLDPVSGGRQTLYALTSGSYQDYMVLIPGGDDLGVVPEPLTATGLLFGVGSVVSYLRRRRRC